jgi:hypothetical protein
MAYFTTLYLILQEPIFVRYSCRDSKIRHFSVASTPIMTV